ncbi:anthranilate synthase component II [Butyrivibrio sp. JL13D10]|uniref:anthranilate synthase component II n=1 Tax=Butyrivibrio sp. JL13D10 TaxID=3236815 RepID=UPI0038B49D26
MVLLIDNYDSFSYNLYQLIGEIVSEDNCDSASDNAIKVIRNDELTISEIEALAPSRIILSPGPGRPEDAGVCMEVAKILAKKIPTLGVCLGHQAICAAYGATVTYAKELMHGKQSTVRFDKDCLLFKGCPETALVARYHSLAAEASTIPDELSVTAATTESGEVMAVKHRDYPIYGVQFHPESIMTPDGKTMLKNFICG